MLSKRVDLGGARYGEFRIEAFNALNHPSSALPEGTSRCPPRSASSTTVSSPRLVELVFKFYY
jgi:hypothetical protein